MLKNKVKSHKSPDKVGIPINREKVTSQKHKLNNSKMLIFLLFSCIVGCALCVVAFAQEATEFTYDSKGKRNPFFPLITSDGRLLKIEDGEGSLTGLSLEGIIYDKFGVSYAIVNGSVVKTGDRAGEFQVLKIEENKVIFIKSGITTEVELKKEE